MENLIIGGMKMSEELEYRYDTQLLIEGEDLDEDEINDSELEEEEEENNELAIAAE